MSGHKRRALTTDIDMTTPGDDTPFKTDTTTMSIMTVTIPTSKRIRASRKSRRHEDLPVASFTPPPMPELPENTKRDPTADDPPNIDADEENRAPDTNDHADIYIEDEDTRSASVCRFHLFCSRVLLVSIFANRILPRSGYHIGTPAWMKCYDMRVWEGPTMNFAVMIVVPRMTY